MTQDTDRHAEPFAGKGQYRIGIDVGGTFTDAALLRNTGEGAGSVLGVAKSPTTHDRLEQGIAGAIRGVLAATGMPAGDIGMVALSTTLATNALAEGNTGATGLVLLGSGEDLYRRSGIGRFGPPARLLCIAGGHDAGGHPLAPLDLAALERGVAGEGVPVAAWAVVGLFAVRNPTHERAARDAIERLQHNAPTTCSHELTAELDAPRRALTTWLNAGLVPRIDALLAACRRVIAGEGIRSPLMVVRGDGLLMNVATARRLPVDTILSGPAASAAGARHLTGIDDGVVADIGGTTTDISILEGGAVGVDARGARVGGRRTFVRAVAARTVALGGDSEVGLCPDAAVPTLRLGPRRVIPLTGFSRRWPDLVGATLERQARSGRPDDRHGRFVERADRRLATATATSPAGQALLAALADGPLPEDRLAERSRTRHVLARLWREEQVRIAALTPTDARELLAGDNPLLAAAAGLFARRRDHRGREIAADAGTLARQILRCLHRESARAVLLAALDRDGLAGEELAASPLAIASMDRHPGLVESRIRLRQPLLAVGAPAASTYPGVADRLHAEWRVPRFAEVAGAVGAAVGSVAATAEIHILQPAPGCFALHGAGVPERFDDLAAACRAARRIAGDLARRRAEQAGATGITTQLREARRSATVGGESCLLELRVRATARGAPTMRPDAGQPAGPSPDHP